MDLRGGVQNLEEGGFVEFAAEDLDLAEVQGGVAVIMLRSIAFAPIWGQAGCAGLTAHDRLHAGGAPHE